MDRIARMCEEIHAFAGSAERTGREIELRGLKTGQRTCTSLTDLIRKYKLYGDGIFYLPIGHWPKGETAILLDNVKWMGVTRAVGVERVAKRKRKRRHDEHLTAVVRIRALQSGIVIVVELSDR